MTLVYGCNPKQKDNQKEVSQFKDFSRGAVHALGFSGNVLSRKNLKALDLN